MTDAQIRGSMLRVRLLDQRLARSMMLLARLVEGEDVHAEIMEHCSDWMPSAKTFEKRRRMMRVL